MCLANASAMNSDLRAERVFKRLANSYGLPDWREADPLEVLVGCLISGGTLGRTATRVIRALHSAFGHGPGFWERVRDAQVEEIQDALGAVIWSEHKPLWVQSLLREISVRRRGELSLDFLSKLPSPVALAWLRTLPGVDAQSARRTLRLSTLAMSVPVEGPGAAILDWLEIDPVRPWGTRKEEQFQELLKTHMQRTCFVARPACGRCPLPDLCQVALQSRGDRLEAA